MDNDVRLSDDYLEQFLPTLLHAINNAVDLGDQRTRRARSAALAAAIRTPLEPHLASTATALRSAA